MIIDIHTHIAFNKIYPPSYLYGMLENAELPLPKEKVLNLFTLFLKDQYCDQLVKQMDASGIKKSVLLIIDGGIGMEEPEYSLEEIFKLHFKVLQKYPDRFLVFAGVDPRRGEYGLALFKKSINEYNFSGLKLYPPMGYAMDENNLLEYYRICNNHNMPVLIHTGPSLSTLHNSFADPIYVYEIAKQFPNINFILAHAGYNLSSSSVQYVLNLPNIFLDIAGFQAHYKYVDSHMIDTLGLIFTKEINSKIVFGSDWPLFNLLTPLSNHISILKELFSKTPNKVPDGLENVLFNNAVRSLNLKVPL